VRVGPLFEVVDERVAELFRFAAAEPFDVFGASTAGEPDGDAAVGDRVREDADPGENLGAVDVEVLGFA
jgi:hypothetical protein